MKRRLLALLLIGGCLLMFAGCTQAETNLANSVMSIASLPDFSFTDTLILGLTDEVKGEPEVSSDELYAAGEPLEQGELQQIKALGGAKIEYEGSVGASREQFYLKKTITIGENSIVSTIKVNGDKYSTTLNGEPVVTDGDFVNVIAEIKDDLALLGLDTGELAACVNSPQFFDYLSHHLPNIFKDLHHSDITEYPAGHFVFNLNDEDFSNIAKNIIKIIKQDPSILHKLDKAINVSLIGDFNQNEDYSYDSSSILTVVAKARVKTCNEEVNPAPSVTAQNEGGYDYECHKLTLTATNSLFVAPIIADANVVTSSITSTAANFGVIVAPDDTIASRGIIYSMDPLNVTEAVTAPAELSGSDYVVSLTGLTPDTTYYYQGYGLDEAGFTVKGAIKSFKTLAAPVVVQETPAAPVIPNPETGDNGGTMIPFIAITASSLLLFGLKLGKRQKKSEI